MKQKHPVRAFRINWSGILDWIIETWFPPIAVIGLIFTGIATVLLGIACVLWIFSDKTIDPPPMTATLLEVVRYCEPLARDEHSHFNDNATTVTYSDSEVKFAACLRGYEYAIER